jgi:hypothetical protein
MPLTVPASKPYPNPLASLPARWDKTPPEGARQITCEILWGAMGGPANCVEINAQNLDPQTFSQIAAMSVDNSLCGSDVVFLFPDTQETLSVPAYLPKAICEVFTQTRQFWVSCPNALPSDITRLTILNTTPPPVVIPVTNEQNIASTNAISVSASGSQQLVPATINGTLEDVYATYAFNNSASGQITWTLTDGTAKVIAQGVNVSANGTQSAGVLLNLNDVAIRFKGGLLFTWVTSGTLTAPSTVSFNVYYRQP